MAQAGSHRTPTFWWTAEEPHDVCSRVFAYVEDTESEQSALFERFLQYASLYDPHDAMGLGGQLGNTADSYVADNVVQSAVDTAASIIAKSRPRIAVNTDGGDWSTQRRAKNVERYIEGLFRDTDFYEKAQESFVDAGVLGTGVLKVVPRGKEITVERVLIDEIVVDERECLANQKPKQIHQRSIVDRTELIARFPDFEDEIGDGANDDVGQLRFWADYRPIELDQVVVVESWRLPHRGKNGKKVAGRHTLCVRNAVLLDEKWEHDDFPFLFYRWASRRKGFYGRGIAEELAGRQRHINRMNWQFDRRLQQISVPRHFVHQADAAMAVKLVNTAGAVIPYRKEKPVTFTPAAVTGEEWMRLEKVVAGGLAQVGISGLTARAAKQPGVESAVAFRELTDIESERFARNAQRWETMHVQAAKWMLAWAKEMDNNAPEVAWRSKSLSRSINFKKVDLGSTAYSLKLDAAGALARTPAGRMQRVMELAQSGLLSTDEARRLLDHPDVQRAMTLANAAVEAAEHEIELVLDGEDRTPEQYMNLPLTAGRFQMAYLEARNDNAPEDVLERMRWYIEMCAEMMKPKGQPQPQMAPPGMAPPMGPPGMPVDPMQQGMPPQAALAAPAMNLQAA